MTCHLYDYTYGHAACCGCKQDIDLASEPSALLCRQGNMLLYFFYCPQCFYSLQAAGGGAYENAVAQVIKHSLAALPHRTGFAMTTSLSLQAHGGDLVKAYEVGVNILRVLHAAILCGEAEVALCPTFGWEA